MDFIPYFRFCVILAISVVITHGENFGILDSIDDPTLDIFGTNYSLHVYDVRDWIGQPTSEVCRILDAVNDLLFISREPCMPARVLRSIQGPMVFVPTFSGACDVDASSNATSSNATITPENVIPFHMFGYGMSEAIPGIVSEGFSWENAVIIHVCDGRSFCGSQEVEAATKNLHDRFITTLQCWIQIAVFGEYEELFAQCLSLIALLPNADRRILVVSHTNYSIIQSSLSVMTSRLLLNMLTEVVFVLPPKYEVTDTDFNQIKDHDIVRIVRWRSETWLASITTQYVKRYLDFWGYHPNVTAGANEAKYLAGLLTTLSTVPHFTQLINADSPSSKPAGGVCSAARTPEMDSLFVEVARLLSCADAVGDPVCTGYSVIQYGIDPSDEMPHSFLAGQWDRKTGYRQVGPRGTDDLRGRTLKVAAMLLLPFLGRNETAYQLWDGTNDSGLYHGIAAKMLDTLSRVLNFKYKLVFPTTDDEYYGARLPDGSWNGMVGMLHRGEVDMIAADLTVTAERQQVVEFTVPYLEDAITILLPRSEFSKSPFAFFNPFRVHVWGCVLAAIALSGPLLYFFSRATPYYKANGKVNHFASLSEAYMYCYGAMVSQGGQITPEADSARAFMAFWWLFGICTVATYSGNLIAFLTFPGKMSFIDNFDDFVYRSNIQPVLVKHTYMETTFRQSDRQLYRDLWAKIQANPYESLVDVDMEAVERVGRKKYGYIGQLSNLKVTISQDDEEICRFATMRNPIEKVKYALAFRKGTNYAPLFNKWVQRLVFSGLVAHWAKEEWDGDYKSRRCQRQLETPPEEIRKVKLEDVAGLYACLAIGGAVSLIIFGLERMTLKSHSFARACRRFLDKPSLNHSGYDLKVITLNNGAVLRPK